MNAHDRDEFRDEIVRFTLRLGFETVSAITVVEHSIGPAEFITVNMAPSGYEEPYSDLANSRRDPVLQHCKRLSVPIIWDQQTYVARGAGDLWEQQASYGYHTGIAIALHLPQGKHFLLGVDRDQKLPQDSDELQRLVADLQLFAVYAQDAALRLLLPTKQQMVPPSLTLRELDALRWTMEGKTAWEVGAVLGISERTAVQHVNNAMHKLECFSKHQAVVKALRMGLIK